MRVIISAPTFDPAGVEQITPLASSELGAISRRVNRVATLDGGAVVNDTGHWAADRTFRIRWRITGERQLQSLRRMVRTYPRLIISTRDGTFSAAPQSINHSDGAGDLVLLVMEQLS